MIRHDRDARRLAIALSTLAGYVDATAFIMLGGFFVSFMSGNTTRLGVGLAEHTAAAPIAAMLIGAFVLGVIAGSLCGHFAGARRRPAVLGLVTLLLAAAALLGAGELRWSAAFVLALAMGAENAVFERDGEVQIGLTYMTGTLVKLGQRVTAALLGGPRLDWLPYFLLWLGLLAGTVLGATAQHYLGSGGLWIATAAAAILAVTAALLPQEAPS
ncbi:MAG: YoaK family protein [Rhizomicrobium sp.]